MRTLMVIRKLAWKNGLRSLSGAAAAPRQQENQKRHDRMGGWQVQSYSDDCADLQFSENLKKLFIRTPSQLLVKVLASSVNPIDVAMMSKLCKIYYYLRKNLSFILRRIWIDSTQHNAHRK